MIFSPNPYDLAYMWGSAYNFTFDGTTWTAERRGEPQHTLYASSVEEMRDLLRQDFFTWRGAL